MTVILVYDAGSKTLTQIGPGGLLHSLFSTIAVHLENGVWGQRFPVIMHRLYAGSHLTPREASAAMEEWRQVRAGLSQLPGSAVVWDIEQPGVLPPWGTEVGSHVASMADYYVTVNGLNLVEDILDHLETLVEFGGTLYFTSTGAGDFPALSGAAPEVRTAPGLSRRPWWKLW